MKHIIKQEFISDIHYALIMIYITKKDVLKSIQLKKFNTFTETLIYR